MLLTISVSPTALAEDGSISGTVTEEETGTPIENCWVNVYNAVTNNWIMDGQTDELGDYNLSPLTTGTYKVQFSAYDGVHLTEWYDDQPDQQSADIIAVTAPDDTSGIDAVLAVGGSISGTVISEGTGDPIDNCSVYAYDATTGDSVANASVDPSDNYTIGPLPTGIYKVRFNPYDGTHIGEWFDNKPDQGSADTVSVTAPNDTSGINALLAVGGSISGTIIQEGTGTPIEDCYIYVYDATTGSQVANGNADSSGNYAVGGIPTGTHKVQFSPNDGIHVREWYDDEPDQQSADLIYVTAPNETSYIDAALTVGGSISGTVTEEGTGNPIAYCNVEARNASTGDWVESDSTDELGNYTLGPLPTGTYKVHFSIYDETHLREWYDDKPDEQSADIIYVFAPMDTPGVDAELAVGGSISGTVIEEGTGNPVTNCWVVVYDAATYNWVEGENTDSSGNYTVGAIPTGTYKVEFSPNDGVHVREWYDDRPDFESADSVTVAAPEQVSINDAVLVVGGSISGTVTEEGTGAPITSCSITAYDAATDDYLESGNTDSLGNYTIGGLVTGEYKVRFSPYDEVHVREWYNDKPSQSSADPVPVNAPFDTGGVDAALAVGGSISGMVTEEGTGAPIGNCNIYAYDAATGEYITSVNTGTSGNYALYGLATGSYVVRFDPGDEVHVLEWYNDKPDKPSADPVSVTAPGDTPGINAELEAGGTISGIVIDELTANPIVDCRVEVHDVAATQLPGTAPFAQGDTDASGNYTVGPVKAGDYQVRFSPQDGAHVSEWYNGKLTKVAADPVTVTSPGDTSNINATLEVGGSMSGTVIEEGTGNPIGGCQVITLDPETMELMVMGQTDASGDYTLEAVATGSYKVLLFPQDGIHLPEFYDNKASWTEADPVSVEAPGETSGIDAELAVASGPTIGLCYPADGAQGQTVDVVLFGVGTHFEMGVSQATFSGDGITVNSTMVGEPNMAMVNITIDPEATPGFRNVNVITGDEIPEPLVGWFLVRDPQITSVNPGSAGPGETLDVEIEGSETYFRNGVSQASFSGTGITVNSTRVTGITQATANITIAADATLGLRDVTVTTVDEVAIGEGLFEVLVNPWIDNLDPTIGYQGSYVTINGSDFGDTQEEDSYVTFQRSGCCGPISMPKVATVISWSDTQIVVRVPSGLCCSHKHCCYRLCCRWGCCGGSCCGPCGTCGTGGLGGPEPVLLPISRVRRLGTCCWRCLLSTHCHHCWCCLSTHLHLYCPAKVRVHRMGVESNYKIFNVRCWPILRPFSIRPVTPSPSPGPG